MLYKTLLKIKANEVKTYGHLTDETIEKIDTFYALGKITEEQYKDLLDLEK